MPDFDLMEAIKNAQVKLDLGNVIVALIDVDGVEYAAGYAESVNLAPGDLENFQWILPYPTSELRTESEAKKMIEEILTVDIDNGNEDKIFAVVIGYEALFYALGEGLIVDNRVDPKIVKKYSANPIKRFFESIGLLKPNTVTMYEGRILALGRVWKFIVEIDTDILPNAYSAATVDRNMKSI